MKTKTELLDTMEAHGACEEATLYVLTHDSDSALEIGLDCSRVDWLIWLLVYEGVSLTDFVAGCAKRAGEYAEAAARYDNAAGCAKRAGEYAEAAARYDNAAARYAAARYAADDTARYAANAAARYAANAADAAADDADDAADDAAAELKIQLEQLHALWTEWYKS